MRSHEQSRSLRAPIVLAALASAIGIVVLVSWWIAPSVLDPIRAPLGGVVMTANTALLLVLEGVAVVLAVSDRRRAARVIAALALALAAVTFVERVAGIDLHLDGMLAAGAPPPALLTAVALGLLALAIAVLDVTPRRGPAPAELLAFGAAAIALLIATAHGFGYAYLTPPGPRGNTMAIHTALAALALALAVLLARPRRGVVSILASPFVGGVIARRLLVVGLLAAPLAGMVAVALQRAGVFPAPGAAVIDSVISTAALFVALTVLAHALNRGDARRTELEVELAQWKRFFDDASFGAVLSAPDRVLHVNDAFARMHGHRAADLIGRPPIELFAPAVRASAAEQLQRVETAGQHRFESVHVRKDGSTFPVVVDAASVRDAGGRLLYRVAYVQDITADKRAEAARARLAALVDAADDAIIAQDLDGTVLAWNHGAERIFGWTAAEMIGQAVGALVPGDRRHERDEVRARLARGEIVRALETERLRKDGTLFPVSATFAPVTDADGRTIVSTIVRDVSQRREAERALADAHRRLADVVEASVAVNDAVTRLRETGLGAVLEEIARQAKLVTGADYAAVTVDAQPDVPETAAVGAPPRRFPRGTDRVVRSHDPDDADVIDLPVTHHGVRRGGIVLLGKGDTGFSDGDRLAAEMLASRLSSAIEIALLYQRESLQRAWLEAVLAQMPEGVIVVDERARVLLENDATRKLPIDHQHLPFARALAGETIAGEEQALRTADHGSLPILVSAKPVRIGGAIAGAVGLVRDIRDLKELERRREEWSSVIAHDLRQPINGIRLAAELLGRAHLEPRYHTWSERIRADAMRMSGMIQDLLDSSRLEAKRLSLSPRTVELAEAIDVVLARLPSLLARTEVRIDPRARAVLADETRLVQVLGNLLSNAEKYGAEGTPIVVEASSDGVHVTIGVTNHGAGIAPEDLPALFDRFARTRAARDSGVDGIGLGLYLARGLVEAHGGRMWAESMPGLTTTIWFTLPAAPAREANVLPSGA